MSPALMIHPYCSSFQNVSRMKKGDFMTFMSNPFFTFQLAQDQFSHKVWHCKFDSLAAVYGTFKKYLSISCHIST